MITTSDVTCIKLQHYSTHNVHHYSQQRKPGRHLWQQNSDPLLKDPSTAGTLTKSCHRLRLTHHNEPYPFRRSIPLPGVHCPAPVHFPLETPWSVITAQDSVSGRTSADWPHYRKFLLKTSPPIVAGPRYHLILAPHLLQEQIWLTNLIPAGIT